MASSDRRHLRMPLATGGGALAMLTVPVGVFQVLAFGPLFFSEVPDWVPRGVGGVIVVTLGIVWALWIFVVLGAVVGGWKRRCSDIWFSPRGLRILGGPGGGLVLRWDQEPPPRCVLGNGCEGEPGELLLEGRRVAISEDATELLSFAAIDETVQALGRRRDAPPSDVQTEVLACSQCGAPIAPVDRAQTNCRHCSAAVAMPKEVLDRFDSIEQLESSRIRVEALLRSLLRQRGARFTNAILALALPPLLSGFPLTAILFNEFYVTQHVLRGVHALWLLPFALSFTFGLLMWLRGQVVGRRALRLVAFSYGARLPREGDPWCCRLCGAPLPEGDPEQLVKLCLYCQAENLTGLDLSHDAQQMKAQAGSLHRTLREHLGQRRRWRYVSLVAAALLVLSAIMLLQAFPRTCRDGVRNGDETDVDCGGVCMRCEPSRACGESADCMSSRCVAGVCATPACDDAIKNGDESDVDCGGACDGCPVGSFCTSRLDCKSGSCGLSGLCGGEAR